MTPEEEERGRWQQATCYSTPMEANTALCSLQEQVLSLRKSLWEALGDGAALLRTLRYGAEGYAGCWECGMTGQHSVECVTGSVVRADHPGSVLLAELASARQELAAAVESIATLQRLRHEAELARIKPSGQVADDVELVRNILAFSEAKAPLSHEALSRLAAKAHGYDAATEAMDEDGAGSQEGTTLADRIRALSEDRQGEKARAERAEEERDAAVADNAALLGVGRELHCLLEDSVSWEKREARRHAALAVLAVLDATHPGDALLERLKDQVVRLAIQAENIRWHQAQEAEYAKALSQARNEGRADAVAEFLGEMDQ